MMITMLNVALGASIGAAARFAVNAALLRLLGPSFPFGTITVNILGSFLMGAAIVILSGGMGNRFAPLLLTGVLGGFTTFSAFSLDALTLYERGQPFLAAAYVGISVIGALLAITAGIFTARWGLR